MEPLEEYKQPHKEFLDLSDIDSGKSLFSKVCCPSCEKDITADHLNIQDKIGKCIDCNVVFPFDDQLKGFNHGSQKLKQEILRPEGIELFSYKDELELSFRASASVMDIFVFIFGFMHVFPLLGVGLEKGLAVPIIMAAALSLFLLLYLIMRWTQKKYVTINERHVIIESKPKFLSRFKSFDTRDINQIYVYKNPNGSYWELKMILDEGKGQKHIKLTTLNSASKAKFLEQEIERHLGIQDVEVPEES